MKTCLVTNRIQITVFCKTTSSLPEQFVVDFDRIFTIFVAGLGVEIGNVFTLLCLQSED